MTLRPAAEQNLSPRTLLQASTRWVAAAVADGMRPVALDLRAGAQAAQRSLAVDQAGEVRAMTDLRAGLDRLDERLAALQRPSTLPGARVRLLPEREVAAAVSLLADAGAHLGSAIDERTPRVSGHPGLIGVATLHLLLGHAQLHDLAVRADRPAPDRLRVQIVDPGSADRILDGTLHVTVLATVVDALGGQLDLQADTGPGFEVPLEL